MTATLIPNVDDLRIAEQMALAKNLREKGMTGTGGSGMAGNVYMVGNQYGNLAQSLGGALMGGMADRNRQQLEGTRNQQYEDYMRQMPSATMQKTNLGTDPGSEQSRMLAEQEGVATLPETSVLKSARQQQQEVNKFSLNAPNIPQFQALRQAGMLQALSAPEKQAAAEEAAANRKAMLEATLADRAASREEKIAAEKELERMRQEGRKEIRMLAASLRPAPAPHNAQTVVSDQGILERQPDGTWKPITVGDKTAMKPSTGGGAQGSLAKLTPTEQKELFETDEMVQASKNSVDLLNKAKEYSKDAYSGYFAATRAQAKSALGGGSKAADATIQLNNILTGQGLEALKATFGAAPTEGERKILLEMQASADKTPAQRAEILDRAIAAANKRIEFNSQKAKAIRDRTYASPSMSPSAPAPIDFEGLK